MDFHAVRVYKRLSHDNEQQSQNIIQQLILMADIMVFWSALPYLLFGDVFRMSERINPDNPRNGKYVLRILGTASIILGFVLIFVSLNL